MATARPLVAGPLLDSGAVYHAPVPFFGNASSESLAGDAEAAWPASHQAFFGEPAGPPMGVADVRIAADKTAWAPGPPRVVLAFSEAQKTNGLAQN